MRRARLSRLRTHAARDRTRRCPRRLENAVKLAGGLITYTIDALVVDGDMVAVAWTGALPSAATMRGLSLYRATGGMLRSTRHALIGDLPALP